MNTKNPILPTNSMSILYAGTHLVADLILDRIKLSFPHLHISINIVNSDDTWWQIEEVTNAFSIGSYDLSILYLNNAIAIQKGAQLSDYESRCKAVCSLVADLVSKKLSRVICLYGADDAYWPERAIASGARGVFHTPANLDRLILDLPIIMDWEAQQTSNPMPRIEVHL